MWSAAEPGRAQGGGRRPASVGRSRSLTHIPSGPDRYPTRPAPAVLSASAAACQGRRSSATGSTTTAAAISASVRPAARRLRCDYHRSNGGQY